VLFLGEGIGGKRRVNLIRGTRIQKVEESVLLNGLTVFAVKHEMTTWHKRDWEQYYELARRPWRRHRPPRPVYPTGLNRVLPAQGFSLSELDDAGVDLDLAERLGLPVDAGRIGAYGPNVTVLRDFIRSSRQPL
jgi:ribosomal protein L13E